MREIIRDLRWHLLGAEVAMVLLALMALINFLTGIAQNIAVIACITHAQSTNDIPKSCGIALTMLMIERQDISMRGVEE